MHLHTEVPSIVLTALSCDLRQKSDWLKIMWLERARIAQQLPHLGCGGDKLSMEGIVWMNCRWIHLTNTDEPIESSIWLWRGLLVQQFTPLSDNVVMVTRLILTHLLLWQPFNICNWAYPLCYTILSLWLKFHPFQVSNPGRLGHWPLSQTLASMTDLAPSHITMQHSLPVYKKCNIEFLEKNNLGTTGTTTRRHLLN